MRLFKPNIEKMSRKRDVPGLLAALESEERDTWIPAARALATIGDERAIGPLGRKVEYWGARGAGLTSNGAEALRALVAFRNERAAQTLVSLFSPQWMEDAWHPAADALVAMGEPAVRPVCEQLQSGKNPGFGSIRAMDLIKRIGSPSALPTVKDFVRGYIGGRAVPQARAHWDAGGTVMADPGIVPLIEYLADQADPEVAGLLADLLAHLTERKGREGGLRNSGIALMIMACITALTRMRATSAVQALNAVVSSPDTGDQEKTMAWEALGSLGAGVDLNAPRYLLAKRDWDKLVAVGEPALETLLTAALEARGSECEEPIDAIARIGGARAIDMLTQASDSPDISVNTSAREALARLAHK